MIVAMVTRKTPTRTCTAISAVQVLQLLLARSDRSTAFSFLLLGIERPHGSHKNKYFVLFVGFASVPDFDYHNFWAQPFDTENDVPILDPFQLFRAKGISVV